MPNCPSEVRIYSREQPDHPVRRVCRMMAVHPSGYYAWSKTSDSERTQEDRRLLGLVKQSWLESGGVYGYRKIQADLRDLGECCGKRACARKPATVAIPGITVVA